MNAGPRRSDQPLRTEPPSVAASRRPATRRRRFGVDPRIVAPLAFIIAFVAIALEIVYTVGHFFSQTVAQIH